MALPLPILAAVSGAIRQLVGLLVKQAGPMLISALAFVGLSFVISDFAIAPLMSEIASTMSGAPRGFLDVVGFVKGDVAMSMILSAYATRATGRLILRRAP